MSVKERNGLNAGRAGGGETEDVAIQHAVDVHHDQRGAPLRCSRTVAQAAAEPQRLHDQEIARIVVLAVEILIPPRKTRVRQVGRPSTPQPPPRPPTYY